MARNSIESTVQLVTRAPVTLIGTLIGQTKSTVTFKYRPAKKRVVVQDVFSKQDVISLSNDTLVLLRTVKIGRPIKGVVEAKDDGIYVDGVFFHPDHVLVTAEIGIEDKPAGEVKKKKKKAA